jgi:hypothetical protein
MIFINKETQNDVEHNGPKNTNTNVCVFFKLIELILPFFLNTASVLRPF